MSQKARNLTSICLLVFAFIHCTNQNDRHKRDSSGDQPRILTHDGHLIFQTAQNHNITFQASIGGAINIGGENLLLLSSQVKKNKEKIEELARPSSSSVGSFESRLQRVEDRLETFVGTAELDQINSLVNDLTTRVSRLEGSSGSSSGSSDLQDRVQDLEDKFRRLKRDLNNNECSSSPCRNGGTCLDLYDGFYCRCPTHFQGRTCDEDVNECSSYLGTDLGCQNGATCINTRGGFSCQCTANWHGVRCTESHDDCTGSSSQGMCGHGTCVNQRRDRPDQPKFRCICDEGWTTDRQNPACVIDVDECNASRSPCSLDPPVQCINLPGSFFCGSCPSGYSGNGFVCLDVDECLANNGGCSQAPRVDCSNIPGSRECGPCPSGYRGDGVTCTYIGICNDNNGGCHQMALCRETTGFMGRVCTCQSGYTGTGEGATGCVQVGTTGGACRSNPCVHGQCQPSGTSYTCSCQTGYSGVNCNQQASPCASNPCQNGGTCSSDGNSRYSCECTASYTGYNCQDRQQGCGGRLSGLSGTLRFPAVAGETYPHSASCAWVITTVPNKILILVFTSFKLERHTNCDYDFLQVNDGPSASSHLIGKYCGDQLPNNGHINTTHNQVYLWFRSDASNSGDGFSLVYNSAEPTCGGSVSGRSHGSVTSPGYPGNYPHNRDCTWNIRVTPGNKIKFIFSHLAMEHHANCSYDYVMVRDGFQESDDVLGRYCSSNDPSPVETSGPYGQIMFHSDESSNDRGFHISYITVPSAPGCGGTYTAESGTIISPNYPNSYPNHAQCVWTITVPSSAIVTLTFTAMNIEDNRNCRYDYIQVRDGDDELSPFVGRYCGNQIPPAVISSGNSLWVKFKTDGSVSNNGFRATWTVECGGTFVEPSGELLSPYFPDPYPAQKDCEYVITQPGGSTIVLTFLTFDIEASSENTNCNYDYLEIRNGASESGDLIGRFCGSSVPQPITSSGSSLWVKFHSDGSVQNHGFRATYNTENTGNDGDLIEGAGCGGTFNGPTGSFSSPSHPSVYPHGINCTWFITVDDGLAVSLTFNSFSIESHPNCRYDSVAVFSSFNTSSLIARFCGMTSPGTVLSPSGTMMVIFTSDSSVSMEGFSATYTSINASSVCGGTFHSVSGVLTSPNYPSTYPANRLCRYDIVAPQGQQIMLNVTDFSLETTHNCVQADYLEIRNGGSDTSPLIGQYCGTTVDQIIRSHSNRLHLKFVSDNSEFGRGFSISYDATQSGCGGEMLGDTGSFVSPNYPQQYHSRAECFWSITVSRGSTINLVFVDLDTESAESCNYDYVEIRENNAVGAVRGRFCGRTPPLLVQTRTNKAWIKFRSDYSGSGRGFHIMYSINCVNRLTTRSGVIESPNFPDPYPHNRNCSWVVEVPRGNTINASFSHFRVEPHDNCQYDYLQLRDGEKADSPLIGQYCGVNILPPEASTTGRYLYIKFRSDASTASNGFRLEYTTVGCGGEVRGSQGIIQSPNYPAPYLVAQDCVWTIETNPGSRIELTIVDMDIEAHHQCQSDYIQAQGGLENDSPILFKLCQTPEDRSVYTTTGNQLKFTFSSDRSQTGRGFKISYREVTGGCGGNYSTESGVITSQNYPNSYPHNTDCLWNIRVAPGRTVTLTFEDMSIEAHDSCQYDYLVIYDGPDSHYPSLLRTCGMTLPDPPQIHSSSNQMTLRMRSDSSVASHGFKASFDTGCGGTLDASVDGEIVSPGWPATFERYINCSWLLQSPHLDDHMTLTFTHLDLQGSTGNCTDYVRILGGNDDSAPEISTICGNFVPTPIRTQSSAIFIRFVSNSLVGRTGFRLVYSTSSSACGGEFTSERGAFSSPLYPESYSHNTECIWTFNTSPGNKILISFPVFNLEASPYCNHDFLEVRDGGVTGQVMGRYCGSNTPTNVTMGTNLWLKFRSNANITAPGFQAVFNSLYGGEITGSSGEIASPQFPQNYPYNADYSWLITTDVGKLVKITFLAMDIEIATGGACSYDYVRFRDGGSIAANSIGLFCGNNLPPPITTSGNQLLIEFHSDYSVTGSGFSLKWQAVPPAPVNPTAPGPTMVTEACGGDLVAVDGLQNVTSPGYPYGYPSNTDCIWVIRSEVATRIWVNLTDISLEYGASCRYDYVTYYNGDSPVAFRKIGLFCGQQGIGQLRLSASNAMVIRFHSDDSVNRTGFMAQFKTVCGGSIRGPVGVLQSMSYPDTYSANSNCTWRVSVQTHRKIQVTLTGLDIPASPNQQCTGDYLQLLNGVDADSPPLGQGRYCGNTIPTIPMTTSNMLTVRFVSDGSGGGQGFKLTYREYLQGCGGTLSLTDSVNSGMFTSPSYPGIYPQNVDCIWIITSPANQRVQIDFIDNFAIESHQNCEYDYVEVRDGGTEHAQVIGRFCGNTSPGTQKSTGNVMFVRFRSDNSVPKTGFKIQYKIARCGGTINGDSGVILSPGYPATYQSNLDCEWTIQGPTGHYLTFIVEEFQLEGNQNCTDTDLLVIRDYNATGDTLLEACGRLPTGRSVESSDNSAYIHFTTNQQIAASGFRIRFQASVEECGGVMTTPTGTFSSPNYPGVYAHRRRCVWTIRVAQGRRITLTFTDFDLEEHSPCYLYDSIWLVNGALQQGYLNAIITTACGHTIPDVFESSNNGMQIYFVTDGSVSGRGFQATYTSDNPMVCGGLLTTADGPGSIESPGFSNRSYPNGTQCIWQLANHNAGNGSISVQFTFLSLEEHGECRWDLVEIREGSDENGHLVGRYCGNKTQNLPRIASPFSSLWIIFKSDMFASWEGFQLQYKFTSCGGTLVTPSGMITSPNYPANYNVDGNCAWIIRTPDGQQIKLHFTMIDIEQSDNCEKDYIEVFNGGLSSSPSVGHYCGSVLPPDVTSMSDALRLEFHSDGDTTARGFRLMYEFVENGCGGDIHSQSGQLTSPQWPGQYPNNAECQWQITVHNGYHVMLNFTPPFELEIQQPCINDYVQVSEVLPSSELNEMGRYCGNQFPAGLQATSNKVKVKFRSNDHITGNGFALNFTSVCGATFTEDEGTILSPGYPHNYENDMVCNYTIIHEPQTFINIYFDPAHFGIEGQRENIKLRQHGRPRGLESSSTERTPTFSMPSHGEPTRGVPTATEPTKETQTLETSAPSIAINASSLVRRSVSPTTPSPVAQLPTPGGTPSIAETVFRQYLHNASVPINVPDTALDLIAYSATYPNSPLPTAAESICRHDWVIIYEGADSRGRTVTRACGMVAPQMIRVQGSAFIQFRTDHSTTDKGWRITYNTSHCGGNFVTDTGSLQTPTHPDNYHDNANCTWVIHVPSQGIIELKFNEFSLESSDTCQYDYAALYDGNTLDSPLIAKICGINIPPIYRSTGRSMLINFISDGSVAREGFTATWRTTPGAAQGCGGLLNAPSGVLRSVDSNHDNKYDPNLRCVWQIVVPSDRVIQLHFDQFRLDAQANCLSADYVQIRDGLLSTDTLVGVYCGGERPTDFTSTTNRLYISFVTDDIGGSSGFSASYTTAARLCGGSHIASSTPQNITSPRYPDNYVAGLQCVWTIDAPPDQHVLVKVKDISIQGQGHCQGDYLQFIKVATSNSSDLVPSTHTHCGSTVPGPYISHGRIMQILFVTDAFGSDRGFNIEYQLATCNTTYGAMSGRITSPGWPGSYPSHSHCEFLIQSPEGTQLAIYFTMFNTELDPQGCRYDYLEIHNGTDGDGPVLTRACGRWLPDPIFVTSNALWMHFQTDNSIHRPGYDITYIANYPGECGGNLTIPEGSFTSPGFPGNYQNISRVCSWLIRVPNRQAVALQFRAFDIPASAACVGDSVSVYNGGTTASAAIGRFCGEEQSPIGRNISTNGNTMLLVFRSGQSSDPGTGFRVKFSSVAL